MTDKPLDTGVPPSGSGYSAEPEPSFTVSAVSVSIPNAAGVRRGFGLISEHINYLERENERLNELLTTYSVNALRGDGQSLLEFIKDYGRDVHRDRKSLTEAISEFQASRMEARQGRDGETRLDSEAATARAESIAHNPSSTPRDERE
jgi:hypothetical protein